MKANVLFPKAVKRITVVRADSAGGASSVELYKSKKGKKKQTRGLKIFEQLARRSARANSTFADTYLDRHNRSNRKRRDGWLRDSNTNVMRANRKAAKKLKLPRMFRM